MAQRVERGGAGAGQWWRIGFWSIAAALLLMPLIAMQFSEDVRWTLGDFVMLGALLLTPGLVYELVVRRSSNAWYRAGAAVALAATVLLVLINGAVGIIGSEDNDANLMYGAVPAVWAIVAAAGRFRAAGMARAMVAAAAAQTLVAVIAMVAGAGSEVAYWPLHIVALTGAFVAVWMAAAWLFQRAGDAGAHRDHA